MRYLYSLVLVMVLAACGDSGPEEPATAPATDSGPQTPGTLNADGSCSDAREGYKNVYFGDLHTHTSYSLDAYFFNALTDPRAAHRFAKGAAPLPQPARGTQDVFTVGREITIDRSLDFNAVTDHAEFLGGFVLVCDNTEQSQQLCDQALGQGIRDNVRALAAGETPLQQVLAQSVAAQLPTDRIAWQRIQQMNDEEYEPCRYTTLHGYEYTSNEKSQMLHRNVIFKGDGASVPVNVFPAVKLTTPLLPENGNDDWDLFDHLNVNCLLNPECDVLTIPHNANLSDGRMYLAADETSGMTVIGDISGVPLGRKVELTSVYFPMTAEDATLRSTLDRSFEMTQHKGQSECAGGLEGQYLANDEGYDPYCDFEINKTVCSGRPDDPASCAQYCKGDPKTDPHWCSHQTYNNNAGDICIRGGPDGSSVPAGGGAGTDNCSSPLDYYRNAMAEGLKIHKTLGVNPYKANITAALDTHAGDSGNAQEWPFSGHSGVLDDEPHELLGFWGCDNEASGEDPADPSNCTNRTFIDFARALNTGGLAGVWAPQNTREHIWDAIHRGESFGTSGPRIRIRSIASWAPLPANICERLASGEDLIASGEIAGARMGDTLPAPGAVPHIAVWAQQDPEGHPLQGLDLIKGYVDQDGQARVRVFNDVVKTAHPVNRPNRQSCAVEVGHHPESLCAIWQDESFDADASAYWYARVREVPSCRWSAWMCNVEAQADCSLLDPANGMFPEDSGMRGYEGCCAVQGEPGSFTGENFFNTLEQRAWASPIWYEAAVQ